MREAEVTDYNVSHHPSGSVSVCLSAAPANYQTRVVLTRKSFGIVAAV